MSPTSAFGNLLTQYRARKPGLTQTRLAILAGYDPPLVTRMCQGKKELTGPSGRDRALRLMAVLCDEEVLATMKDTNLTAVWTDAKYTQGPSGTVLDNPAGFDF